MASSNANRETGTPPCRVCAAIDLGTNNCRLLIARASQADFRAPPEAGFQVTPKAGFRVIGSYSRIVRLGEDLQATGALSEAAMARTIEALGVCAKRIGRHDVWRVRGVATEACRRASNGRAFVDRVAGETGIELEIITRGEEARLAFAGCEPLIDGDAPNALIFDIGGGSTEILWIERDAEGTLALAAWTSAPCGVVALAEEFGGDHVTDEAYAAIVDRAQDHFSAFDVAHGVSRRMAAGGTQMLGASGTVTTIAGALLGLRRYDRARVDGLRMGFGDIAAVSERLRGLNFAGRAAIPSIGPERADLVVAGCAIVDAIHRTWPVAGLRVADRGLREGMLAGLIGAGGAGSAAAAA
jgi:exopolyphosphatase/guanosine-5'-triphosphate,3'-diphosphate pyrophosphatase